MNLTEATEILNNHMLCLSGKMVSKPKQKELTEALEIAIHQISQLIPTNHDVMQACIDQIEDSDFEVGYIDPQFVEKFKPTINELSEAVKNELNKK